MSTRGQTLRRGFLAVVILLPVACVTVGQGGSDETLVDIVISPDASTAVKLVADELAGGLGKVYSGASFAVSSAGSGTADHVIYFGRAESFRKLRDHVGKGKLTEPESYVVTTARLDGSTVAMILGHDSRGAVYAAYNLLEKLGCGFYLSYDAFPGERRREFSFDGWELSDVPLVRERVVFNWHNFLSGCSTWNLADWQRWITQSQKMGYNAVMVHAYGNNPMVQFSFNGLDKPVGYLSTTRKGRDWSTQHVNDVRRLWGGFVFDGPVFGCAAAMVPDAERSRAARELMHDVFEHAQRRDMDVYFAVDVDTTSANPQAVIETLPVEARFAIGVEQMRWMNQEQGKIWLANPDTTQGYRYYKAQVRALVEAYPQIDWLVVWFRHNRTPWMALKAEEMPASWRKEYAAEIRRTPEAAELWRSHNFFALGKIVTAFERALKEIGRGDVKLAAGSWHFDFLPGCDRFLPKHVELIPLDWNVLNDKSQIRDAESRRFIAQVGRNRPVLPVVWAHHDDGNYVGRPYTPYSDFHSRLVDSRASGFGIIHWTTRPLDLYFKSLAKQVWRSTENQPLRVTCAEMAERSLGSQARDKMAEYLCRWVTESPKIGRDTSDYFIDRKLADSAEVAAGYEQRMKLIDGIDRDHLGVRQRDRLDYFRGLERYITDVHLTEESFRRSQELYKAGDLAGAREAMETCSPEKVIEDYARTSSLGGITRGEQGLAVSMNLRWLTHYVRYRQMLGIEPVRYNFAPTSHDPLAQSMGTFTFHFGPGHDVWECFGTKEMGAAVLASPEHEEICRHAIEIDRELTIAVQPIMAKGGRGQANASQLPAGRYELALLTLDAESTGAEKRVFDVTVSKPGASAWYLFEPVRAKYLRIACHGNSKNTWNSIQEVRIDSLATDGSGPIVKASGAVKGYPAENTVDGKANTRWAADGRSHWIQYRLDPNVETDGIAISWYQEESRQAKFDVLVSDDGQQWTNTAARTGERETVWSKRIELNRQAMGGTGRQAYTYPVTLDRPGRLDVTLKPVKGKVLLCGVTLRSVDAGK